MPAPQGPAALRLAVPSLRLAGRAPLRVPSQETMLPGARVRGAGPRSGRRRRRALEAGGTGRLTGVGKDGRLCARAALSTCAAPGGGVGAWRGAVKGRIARGRRRRCVSFCGGLAGWGCDLASRCVRSAAESQCERSCLCPRARLASALRPLRGCAWTAWAARPPRGAALQEVLCQSSPAALCKDQTGMPHNSESCFWGVSSLQLPPSY